MTSIIIDPIEHKRRMDTWSYIDRIWDRSDIAQEEIVNIFDQFFAPTITVRELREYYARGEREFIDISLPHKANLTGINLAGANLIGAKFNHSNLTGANLNGANLRYAWINGVNFTEANLEGVDISWADATGAILKNASLLNAIGQFGINCDALYENTIRPNGSIIKGPYRPFG